MVEKNKDKQYCKKNIQDVISDAVFFFGAGAEGFYGLPSGGEYTYDTMLKKKGMLYSALKDFYIDRGIDGLIYDTYQIPKYRAEYLFSKNSNTLYEIVLDALAEIKSRSGSTSSSLKIDSSTSVLLSDMESNSGKDIILSKVYSSIILDEEKDAKMDEADKSGETDAFQSLIKNLTFHGAVEQDFSSLVSPAETGAHRFWRLINFFWSAYFSIVLPLLEKSEKYTELVSYSKEEKYRFVLNNLEEITNYLYSEDYHQIKQPKNYYDRIYEWYTSTRSDDCQDDKKLAAITTNYTPFVKSRLHLSDKNVAYLAGELRKFEAPQFNAICNLNEIRKEFFFPYMLTQAYVKPIISPYQLREYSKALALLDERKYLIIIGYSLCLNDNHICSMIKEFIENENKTIIFFRYLEIQEEFDYPSEKAYIKQRLKIRDDRILDRVVIVPHDGNPESLIDLIMKAI